MDQDLGQMFAGAFWQGVGYWVAAAFEWAAAHPWQTVLIVASAIVLGAISSGSRRRRRA